MFNGASDPRKACYFKAPPNRNPSRAALPACLREKEICASGDDLGQILMDWFQAWAFWRIFNKPAFGFEFNAEGVGSFEIFCFAGSFAFAEQLLQLARHFARL